MNTIKLLLLVFFGSILITVFQQACQPAKDAFDALSTACEGDLSVSSPIILEAEKRGIPATQLAKTFCAAKDIYDLWSPKSKASNEHGPKALSADETVQQTEATPTDKALDLLRVRGEI